MLQTILLTGASEGMGLSVAKQLAEKGANLFIVARNAEKLETALAQIKTVALSNTQLFQYFCADISKPGAALEVVKEATRWNNDQLLDVVWCIAGSAHPGLFIDVPIQDMRYQMDINFWSCVEMAQAILPGWLSLEAITKKKTRHLIFTSSVVAFFPVAGYASYAPSKAAIKSLSDTLAQELILYADEIKVHTVFPGTIQSPGLDRENKTKPDITHILEESDPVQTPDVVATKAITGLEKGEYLVTVGWLGDAMRGCAWGGSKRNSWVIDTVVTWITSLIWPFITIDLNGKVRSYRQSNGHPSTYTKSKKDHTLTSHID
ncbi:3-ketodihydrosphingosine reductase gsl-3 [Erysiphe neolycopersici]|uniref:3-dehydrosphinganine reductase n=1 Tax=Erysiphe neolycopersici TaxID=212602 RepID=A0A420HDP7_9PEZI|nr:3-ketodihydrosphingosine reductase gsl-3 [Erysiphe neolycopersici]